MPVRQALQQLRSCQLRWLLQLAARAMKGAVAQPGRVASLVLLFAVGLPGWGRAQGLVGQSQPPADWVRTLSEEFDTPGDSSGLADRWQFAYPWGRSLGGLETEYYTGAEVAVRQGLLLLTAHRLPAPRLYRPAQPPPLALRYTSGMVFARHSATDSLRPKNCPPGAGVSYGWFEIRCRLPRTAGSFPAFWLWGAPDELDIMEAGLDVISNNVHLNSHEYWRPGPVEESECQCFYEWPAASPLAATFHSYALEWLPHQLTFFFDGVAIRRETRFLPLGCQQSVIANLAQWAWAQAPADTLAIDYIRIYRPKKLPPPVFGSAGYGPRKAALFNFPKLQAPEYTSALGQQTWQLRQTGSHKLYVALQDNFNPACASHWPLPTGPDWRGAWQVGGRATPLVVLVPAPMAWELLDLRGQLQRQGDCAPGTWEPSLTDLPPGMYYLRLRMAEAVGYQQLCVWPDAPAAPPTPEWLQPPPKQP